LSCTYYLNSPRNIAYYYKYNENGNLAQIDGPDTYDIDFTYDANGVLISSLSVSSNELTTYEYNRMEQLVRVIHSISGVPEGHKEYTYYENGNLIEAAAFAGSGIKTKVVNYEYTLSPNKTIFNNTVFQLYYSPFDLDRFFF